MKQEEYISSCLGKTATCLLMMTSRLKKGEIHMKRLQLKKQLKVQKVKARSYWERGVYAYAFLILSHVDKDVDITTNNLSVLLNGARNWQQYSEAGNAFVSDLTIAETLCTPSELKKTKGGERNPNRHETWLDVQARALYQAAEKIRRTLILCDR